ncbi:hypothetical protein [Raineyella sp. W15-4]|uniref:hypothetical protein n=1 Tax=Raineyella sp. W15-4 TaxID=3081651 RepID=UPI0029532E29|nr:hypothetical protein [Raineyella sp. W15-4]WOQ15639.1 hypothetical protein R0145_10345 [Raineyella sp. W15-4]
MTATNGRAWWHPLTSAPAGAEVEVTIPAGTLVPDVAHMADVLPAGLQWTLKSADPVTLRRWRAAFLGVELVA